jgi:hypothetical protein
LTAITTFRGGFKELAAMMEVSWSANKENPLLYTSEFLANAFEYPGSILDLAPACYGEERLKAFVAGFPRSVLIEGRPTRLLVNSFLTASVELRGSGIGLAVWRELVNRAKAGGFDGTINFCVEGDEMNRMMPAIAKLFRLNTQRIYSIEYLVRRFLRPAMALAEEATEDEVTLFLELAASLPHDLPLRRTWTREEAVWQCRRRSGAVVESLTQNGRAGMITGYLMGVAGTPPSRTVLMEDLLWGTLDAEEQAELLRRFLQAAASRGAQTASCPVLGYTATDALTAAGFKPSRRILHAYLTLWNDQQPTPLQALYIDVF